jgi:cytoskeletal protein RodZ
MKTPKDTDLREALRRKYANTPQMKRLSLTPRPLQGERERKRKVFPLSWKGIGGGLIAASIALLIAFNYINKVKPVEETPVVAEVVEPEVIEQPAPENSEISESPEISESSESSEYSEYSENSESSEPQKPVKPKRTRKVQVPKEEPLLAEAEPMPEEAEAESEQTYLPTEPDPYLLAAAETQDVRARGERLYQEVAQLINNH